jgi:transposase
MRGPKPVVVELTEDERVMLEQWARRRKTAQALAQRSRIILACARGGSNTEIAAELGMARDTVAKWRSRFVAHRLEGLTDEPRPGAPRTITDEQVEAVITRTLGEKPDNGDTHWSTRSMAKAAGMSQSAISRIWRAFGLKPHLVQTWKLSTDPQFVDKVRDIVGLYLDPPSNALVLAVDEKSQIQALDRTAPILPGMPTTPERMTHTYTRHGTTSLFAALDVASGSVIAQHFRRHRHQEFLRFLEDHRRRRARGAGPAFDLRQLRHPQSPGDQEMVAAPSPVPPALHPYQRVLAQPRRALVRRADQPQTAPLSPPQRHRTRSRHPPLDQ